MLCHTRRMTISILLLVLLSACLPHTISSLEPQNVDAPHPIIVEQAECAALGSREATSSFVLYLPSSGRWLMCNREQASQRFLPASTFKVPHALIALETGVVTDEFALAPWDGVTRTVAAWNEDTSLASGLRNSTIWFYQDLARRLGAAVEREWVRRLDYGNMEIGPAGNVTHFWLDGELRISAIEQVAFLDRLRRGALPASADNQRRVKAMMETERSDPQAENEWIMYAKSGAVLPIDRVTGDIVTEPEGIDLLNGLHRVGWLVGWIERPSSQGGDAVFALNILLEDPGDLGLRAALSRELLIENGILPASTMR